MSKQDLEPRSYAREPMQRARTVKSIAAQLELTKELIPEASANKSLKNLLESRWDRVRKAVYAAYEHRCGICGIDPKAEPRVKPDVGWELEPGFEWKKRRLECHEIWEYDEAALIQKLSGCMALCSPCHQIKHRGWARAAWHSGETWSLWDDEEKFAVYREGNLKFGTVPLEDHFMKVNGCGLRVLKRHVWEAAEDWGRKSSLNWQIDYGEYAGLLT